MDTPHIIASLFSLPRELFHLILAYLSLSEISKLDQAVLSSLIRQDYLEKIKGLLVGPRGIVCNNLSLLYSWFLKRKIIPRRIEAIPLSPICQDLVRSSRDHLVELDLKRHPQIHPFFLTVGALPLLQTLLLPASNIEDVTRVLDQCPFLETLSLENTLVLPPFLQNLFVKCPRIQHLMFRLTDDIVTCLASHGQQLRSLTLYSGSPRVRDHSIRKLINDLPLEYLAIRNAYRFSEVTVVQSLRKVVLPSLQSEDPRRQVKGFSTLCCNIRSDYGILRNELIELNLIPLILKFLLQTNLPNLDSTIFKDASITNFIVNGLVSYRIKGLLLEDPFSLSIVHHKYIELFLLSLLEYFLKQKLSRHIAFVMEMNCLDYFATAFGNDDYTMEERFKLIKVLCLLMKFDKDHQIVTETMMPSQMKIILKQFLKCRDDPASFYVDDQLSDFTDTPWTLFPPSPPNAYIPPFIDQLFFDDEAIFAPFQDDNF